MHLHLPKPLHGWREFFGEVGIIVIGVLIALGAEQVVERFRSEDRAMRAEKRIHDEIDVTQLNELERVAIRTCLTDRLSELAKGLDSGRSHWDAVAVVNIKEMPKLTVGEIYHIPTRVWVTDAYDEALAQGDLKDMDPKKRAQLAPFYNQTRHVDVLNEEEQRLAASLAPLLMDSPISSGERAAYFATIARLDRLNALIVLISRQLFGRYREMGYAPTTAEIAEFHRNRTGEKLVAGWRRRYGSCVDENALAELDPRLV